MIEHGVIAIMPVLPTETDPFQLSENSQAKLPPADIPSQAFLATVAPQSTRKAHSLPVARPRTSTLAVSPNLTKPKKVNAASEAKGAAKGASEETGASKVKGSKKQARGAAEETEVIPGIFKHFSRGAEECMLLVWRVFAHEGLFVGPRARTYLDSLLRS
jgi:hypothetical protein